MKKIFLVLFSLTLVTSTWAQTQRSSLRGKTKDGKTLTVQYYQGTVEDRIESVKYQLVDELQDEIKSLQANVKDLQNRLDAANKQVKQLNLQKEQSSNNQNDLATLNQQLAEKTEEITQLSNQLDSMVNELNQAQDENNRLQVQLDSIRYVLTVKSQKKESPQKSPIIGIEAGVGAILLGTSVNDPWVKDITLGEQAAIYFGTACLSESFPVSVEAGVGFQRISMATHRNPCETTHDGFIDNDHDHCQAIYTFDNFTESLSLNYIGIPIRLCFGQPIKDRVSVYAKLGATPSINIGTPTLVGDGTYSLKGHYPGWNVTLEDIEELGFVSHHDFYEDNKVETEIKKFNLWGNLAVGAYMPLKVVPIVLNVGFKLDVPIMQIGSTSFIDNGIQLPERHTGLLQNGGRVWIPTFEIGIVYTLK